MDWKFKRVAKKVYNYHNLGTGRFPEGDEKTPHGHGERYNFDRMYMFVSSYDFHDKSVVDLGCNSGWFCFQTKLLGAATTVGIDSKHTGQMGTAIRYAFELESRYKIGMKFENTDLEGVDFPRLAAKHGAKRFDAAFLLSVLHHIHDQKRLVKNLYDAVEDVIFYEDHEFWNDMVDESGAPITVKGEGYRFGWNEDMSWQRRIGSIESYEKKVLDHYRQTWRRETLLLDSFAECRLLGFSEKRRPVLALFKKPTAR